MGIKLTEGAIEVSVYTNIINLVGFFPCWLGVFKLRFLIVALLAAVAKNRS